MLRVATIAACALAGQKATILDMGLLPDPPVPNQPLDLWVTYSLPETVYGGTSRYDVSLNYIPLSPDVEDLCTQTVCPILAGIHNETSHSVFPADVKGLISSKITWTDENGDPLWCVQMKYNVQEMAEDWDWEGSSSSSSGSGSSSSSGSGSSSSSSGSGSSSSSGSGSSSSSSGSGSSSSSSSSSGSGSSSSSSGSGSSSGNFTVSDAGSRAVVLRGSARS